MYIGAQDAHNRIETFGTNCDMYWATVVYFRRSPEAEAVFAVMRMIQQNYHHYAKIYRFSSSSYRNDYAITIAINAVYGHCADSEVEIPWSLVNVEFVTDAVPLSDTDYELSFDGRVNGAPKRFKITTYRQDLHILNKDSLFRMIG
jgi:formyltetrahydrofolate synthetase